MKYIYQFIVALALSSGAFSVSGQTNIAPLAVASASTCNTGACSTLNDLNFGTCSVQQMWISTSTPPSTTPGVEWMQFDWTAPVTFNAITIHHAQTGSRFLAGATVQYYDFGSSQWVTFFQFSGLPDQCINTVAFPSVLTCQRFRLTSFLMTGSQLSNPNFREIEIWEAQAPNVPKDPPSPNFQFTLGQDTLWVGAYSTIINTSTGADKSYWNVTKYSAQSATGPWTNYSTLPKDTLQCNTYGCFIDTARNNPNLTYTFNNRGFYNVALTTVNVNGTNTIEKVVYVDTPKTRPTAYFFATRRQLGAGDRISLNNMTTNAPARIKWWLVNNCGSCPKDSNQFLPNDSIFNPVFAANTPGTYKVCLAVSNSKGADTFCRNDYLKVLPGYFLCHSEPGRVDSVGKDDEGYLYSDLRSAGITNSGKFAPSTCGSGLGFRIAPCADTIYLSLERLRMRPGSFSGGGDSLYVRLNGFTGPILRRFGGASITSLKDTIRVFKYAGQHVYITYIPAVATSQPAFVNDSGFTLHWTSSQSQFSPPTASFTCPDTLYSGYNVRFINGSTGNRLAFNWDLNNDGIYGVDKPSVAVDSVTLNPSITFTTTTPSTRKVCLRTDNCKGSSTFCKTMPIFPITLPPAAEFEVNRVSGFISDTFQMIDKSINGALSWRWRFEPNNVTYYNGTDSTSQFPYISLNSPQSYNVTLVVTNQFGSSSITKNNIMFAIDYGSPNSGYNPTQDGTDFGISRVVINGASNKIDTITDPKVPTYTRMNNVLTTTVYRGGKYLVDVYRNSAVDAQTLKAWADFNRDADYSDEGETLHEEYNTNNIMSTFTFKVPGDAVIGSSRIMIGACNKISFISPTTANIGVYEDFGMKIGNDNVKPVITLSGPDFINAEINKSYTEPGFLALDNIEGDISQKVVKVSDLDISHLGLYTIKYVVSDLYGNVSDTVVRYIQIVMNNSGPTIALLGSDTVYVEIGSSYTESGYDAKDNNGGNMNAYVHIFGMPDFRSVGVFPVTYQVKDAFGFAASKVRTIIVRDSQAPVVISVKGSDQVVHQIGTVFEDAKYVYATDNYWTDVTPMRVNGNINPNKGGTYALYYVATDGSGNNSATYILYVTVTNTIRSTLNLVGSAVVVVPVFSSYSDLGIIAKDYKGDLLPYSSDINEKLHMNMIGDYTITYSVFDGFFYDSATRLVKVRDLESPVISLLGSNPYIQPLCKPYQDQGIKVIDNYDVSVVTNVSKKDGSGIQVTIDSSKVNVCGAGYYYTVYINATDSSGNKAEEKKRVVYVSLTGIADQTLTPGLNLYPNPAFDQVHFSIDGTQPTDVAAIDLHGKTTKLNPVKSGQEYLIDVTGLSDGIYLIRIVGDNGISYSGKVSVFGHNN